MMNRHDVVITGLGVLSPLGCDAGEVLESLRQTRSGIALMPAPPLQKEFACGVIAKDFSDAFTPLERPFLDRCAQMAVLAARQAIQEAGLPEDWSVFGDRAGVHYGNVNGGVANQQAWYHQLLVDGKQAARPFAAMAIMGNAGGAQIAIRHKILGPVLTHASACASSGVAIGEAARAISDGHLDVALAGGAEAALTASLLGVFDGTRALSKPDAEDPSRTCKPFSKQRSGLVVGEGAAFLVLESASHARARGAKPIARFAGYGISCDAHHIGMPETAGQVRALHAALQNSNLDATEIGYVNAHATATDGGDVIEAAAIRAVFGDHDGPTWVSSTKSVHGHLLGAASALEAVITVLALREQLLPASAFLGEVDERCQLRHVGESARHDPALQHALSFSCGFGGTNSALVFSRV